MSLQISIDGGHRTSRSLSAHRDYTSEMFSLSHKPLNLQTAKSIFIARTLEHINHHTANRRHDQIQVTVSLPGYSESWHRARYRPYINDLQRSFKNKNVSIQFIDDTWAALLTESNTLRGICVLCGHGSSVAYIPDNNLDNTRKYDGLGPFLGDHSSGYYLSASVFRSLFRNRTNSENQEFLSNLISTMKDDPYYARLNPAVLLDNPDPVFWLSMLKNQESELFAPLIASMSKAILTLATRMLVLPPHLDSTVNYMIETILDHLTSCLEIADRLSEPLPIVLQGGLLRHHSIFKVRLEEAIRSNQTNCDIRSSTKHTVFGTMQFIRTQESTVH
jgi:hypothetical protein